MKSPFYWTLLLTVATQIASAETTIGFDHTKPGKLPPGWRPGITGPGTAHWHVEMDPGAPSRPNVLKQDGQVPSHSYPWCIDRRVSIKDGFVQVKFKPLQGKEDQAGGLIWRWQDGDNYYIARGNALEDNVIIFRTVKGVRHEMLRVPAKTSGDEWHTLRVDFSGPHFIVSLDGKKNLEWDDDTFKKAGPVGVWTKADSVTAFDDFTFEGK